MADEIKKYQPEEAIAAGIDPKAKCAECQTKLQDHEGRKHRFAYKVGGGDDKKEKKEDRHKDDKKEDRHKEDRHKEDRHKEDRHKEDRHKDDKKEDRHKEDRHKEDRHKEDRHKDDKKEDRHKEDRHKDDRKERDEKSDRHKEDRHKDDKHKEKDSKKDDKKEEEEEKEVIEKYKPAEALEAGIDPEQKCGDCGTKLKDHEGRSHRYVVKKKVGGSKKEDKPKDDRKDEKKKDDKKKDDKKEKKEETFEIVKYKYSEALEAGIDASTKCNECSTKLKDHEKRSHRFAFKKIIPADEEDDDYGDDYEDEFPEFEEPDEESDRSTESDEEEPETDEEDYSDGERVDPEVLALKKEIDRQNKQLLAGLGKKKAPGDESKPKVPRAARPDRLDPVTAKNLATRKRKYIRRWERGTQLMRLVDLEAVSYDVADVPPQTEYELYISNFGDNNMTSAMCQIPDAAEIEEIEIQTDKIHYKNKDIQVPEDLGLFAQPTGLIPQDRDSVRRREAVQLRIDTIKLGKFLTKAYPVFRVLLDEAEIAGDAGSTPSTTDFSESYIGLHATPLLAGRQVVKMSFSKVTPQYLLTVFGPTKMKNPIGVNPDEDVSHLDGVAAVWNTHNPHAPDKLLVGNGALSCGCFSPSKGHIVYGGGAQGSAYVWDLREPDYMHNNSIHSTPQSRNSRGKRKAATRGATIPRFPTYATDWMLGENHKSPIRDMLPVGYNADSGEAEGSEQIATLDQSGVVIFWVLVELEQRDTEISDTDLGLNIFGKLKLAKSTVIDLHNPQRYMLPEVITGDKAEGESPSTGRIHRKKEAVGVMLDTLRTYALEFQPDDPSQFLVGTDTGYTVHQSRFGSASPAQYHSFAPNVHLPASERSKQLATHRDAKYGVRVNSIHFSTLNKRHYVAGFDDGSVSAYSSESPVPLHTFGTFTLYSISCVRWCPQERGLFFALDAAGSVFVFDLRKERPEQRLEPVMSSHLEKKFQTDDGKERITLPVSMEFTIPDGKSEPHLALAYDDGHVDLHALKRQLVTGERSDAFFHSVM